MNQITDQLSVAGTPEEVWALLCEPATVASCIPGAALTADQPGGTYRGTIVVKFGPTTVDFRGEASVAYDHAARRCTIEGRGVDRRGLSRALANGTVSVGGTASPATLTVEGEYHLTGPLEGFARTGGVHVARALLGEFAKNLAALAGDRRVAPTAASTNELNGLNLLWRALAGWLRGGFRRLAGGA